MHLEVPAQMGRLAQTRAANPDAEDLAWRCRAAFQRMASKPKSDEAYPLCEQALQIDPENVRALAILSFKFQLRFSTHAGSDPQADLRRADELASLAIKIDPDFYHGHQAKGGVLLAQGRPHEAIDEFRRAVALNPSAIAFGLPWAHLSLGEPEQAIAYADKAMRLSPNDPFSAALYNAKAHAYGILQDYQEALVWNRRAEAADPGYSNTRLMRSELLALAGQEADAHTTMQQYLANPNASIRTITQLQRVLPPSDNPRVLAWWQKLIEGARKAGLPE
jgi:tetratricopeptide (TPR) repeat protein